MPPTKDDKYGVRSMAEAMEWVSIVTSVVGVMVVPPLGGIWIDSLLGTQGLFAILGAVFGFIGGMYTLLTVVKAKAGAHHPGGKVPRDRTQRSPDPRHGGF